MADREEIEGKIRHVRSDADKILEVTRLNGLREAVLHAIRDLSEASEWLSCSRELGEAGSLTFARISLNAARERLAYVQQLRNTYGPGVMFDG